MVRLTTILIVSATLAIGVIAPVAAEESGFEEIVIGFDIPRLLQKDLYVLYDNQNVFLPVTEIFRLLDINIASDASAGRFYGFFISNDRPYEINLMDRTVTIDGDRHPLADSNFTVSAGELYLKVDLFEELFGLQAKFHFSSLTVRLKLDESLPSYQKLKRQQAQKKLRTRETALRNVRSLPRQEPYFGVGVVDWAVSSSPFGDGGHHFGLGLGAMVLAGDLSVSGGGNSVTGFDPGAMTYRWHYYFDNSRHLTQINLGQVTTGGFLSRRLKGASVTNQPQVPRRIFQTIDVNGYVGDGWEVELWIGSRLVDYQLTDVSGNYHFEVDIYYGTTEIILKLYGPNGEIRTERRYAGVSYNQIPEKTFEYTVSAGVADNGFEENRVYGQANGFYGVSNRLTLGAGTDFPFGSQDKEPPTVAAEATWQATGDLTANASLSPRYAAAGAFSFNRPSLISINGSFTRYFENEFRNRAHQVYSARLAVSSPLPIGGRYYSLRFSSSVNKFRDFSSINFNYGTSSSLPLLHITYLGRTVIKKSTAGSHSKITSEIFVMPNILRFLRPQLRATYDHTLNQFSRYGIQWNRRLFRVGQLSVGVDRNEIAGNYQITASFRLLTGFADFSTRVVSVGEHTSMAQTQRGSVRYDQQAHRIWFDRRNGIGYGSAIVRPYADDNYNGLVDEGEIYLTGIRATIKGGRARPTTRGERFYYDGLRAYDRYLVEVDEFGLDDPTLKPAFDNYEVFCNPNMVTAIDVAVVVVTEVSGMVRKQTEQGLAGVGMVKIMIINDATDAVTEVSTFSSGEYFYLGLVPGQYRIYVDPQHLEFLDSRSDPTQIKLEVQPQRGGTAISNLNFLLIPNE
ncbi:MAG: carboxypeptidase-like regulatory domain-containing protein [bacterium]